LESEAGKISAKVPVKAGIRLRTIILGALLALLFSAINGYLSLNLGMSFGYGAFAIIIAYSLFHRLGGGSCRRELAYVLISSISTLGIYNSLGFLLYMIQTEEGVSFPLWMAPDRSAVMTGSLAPHYWVAPLAFLVLSTALTTTLGMVFASILKGEFIRSRKMIWPNAAANSSLVDACMEGGATARLVGVAALVGFALTFLQHLPSFWGYDLTMVDLSGLLPRGAILTISLSVAFAAVGYMINVNTALSLMASGLVTYLVISPYLVSTRALEYTGDVMGLYNDLLFSFSIGPALGILLLGGVILSILVLLKSRLTKEPAEDESDDVELGYLRLYGILMRGLLSNRAHLLVVGSIGALLFALSWVLNPLTPFPPLYSLLFVLYSFFLASFVEMVLITKMSGETGMGMGIMAIFLYDIPLFGLGYREYTGFWAYPFFRSSPWAANGSLPYLKYADQLDVSWRDIVKAKVIGWAPSILFSALFTIVLWRYVGFGTPMMPAVSLIQSKMYLKLLTSGSFMGNGGGGLNPWTFVGGGVLGALLEVFTPVSMMGLAMGMFLPPHYIVPFGVGGLIRYYTDRRFGEDFYNETGRLVVTGLMASSLLVQVAMTIATNFL
jgi:uncharacterized oligopeptide transporter (OPT) family protein